MSKVAFTHVRAQEVLAKLDTFLAQAFDNKYRANHSTRVFAWVINQNFKKDRSWCPKPRHPRVGHAIHTASLDSAISDLANQLRGVPYALVGGIALQLHGVSNRATEDIDLITSNADKVLEASEGKKIGPISVGGYQIRLPNGVEIDAAQPPFPWRDEAIYMADTIKGLKILSLPYLYLSKVIAGRAKDARDYLYMIDIMDEDQLKKTRELIEKYASSELDDFDQAVMLAEHYTVDQLVELFAA